MGGGGQGQAGILGKVRGRTTRTKGGGDKNAERGETEAERRLWFVVLAEWKSNC